MLVPVPGCEIQLSLVGEVVFTRNVTSVGRRKAGKGVAHDVQPRGEGGEPEEPRHTVLGH